MSDQLNVTLLNLLDRLTKRNLKVILGGGYGLYLKQLHLMTHQSARTLLPIEAWPRPRSTSDLDIFFPPELLVSLADMEKVRSILDEMNFQPIAGSEYWQFVNPVNEVRIDLLTGPIEDVDKGKLKFDGRRARPKGNLQLHAHPVPEAIDLEDNLETVSAGVNVPSPFTYLLMKITAFGDQFENPDKDQGRHHALDVYRIVAMLNEDQFGQTKMQFEKAKNSEYVKRAVHLCEQYFADDTSVGILRMKEHAFYDTNMQISDFRDALTALVNSGKAGR